MNQFFNESRGKEKINELREEGIRNQVFHRSGLPKADLLRGLPKHSVGLLGILGLLGLLVR